jgi:phosphate-selective porin
VAHSTYPIELNFLGSFFKGQVLEIGADAISGKFNTTTGDMTLLSGRKLLKTDIDKTIVGLAGKKGIREERVGVHAVLFPQPFGLQSEWNWGEGPALNDARTAIENQSLHGGYVQAMYRIDRSSGTGIWIPFVRWQYFDGAIKYQANTPQTNVNDWEFGLEWQPDPSVELAVVYHKYNRNDVTRAPYAAFNSDVLRMQLQINF